MSTAQLRKVGTHWHKLSVEHIREIIVEACKREEESRYTEQAVMNGLKAAPEDLEVRIEELEGELRDAESEAETDVTELKEKLEKLEESIKAGSELTA